DRDALRTRRPDDAARAEWPARVELGGDARERVGREVAAVRGDDGDLHRARHRVVPEVALRERLRAVDLGQRLGDHLVVTGRDRAEGLADLERTAAQRPLERLGVTATERALGVGDADALDRRL